MVFPIAGGNESKGYEISNSLRFNDGDSAHLDNTFSSTTNRQTYTYSTWIKRSVLDGAKQHIFGVYIDGSNHSLFRFDDGENLDIRHNLNNSVFQLDSAMVFRDVSAWYHIVISTDTTQSTDSNRIKVYVNGTQISLSGSYPTQNKNTYICDNRLHTIGEVSSGAEEFDGYMAETHFVDGSALAQTDFGKFDDNGVWVPIEYTGSHGTNGFYLEFKQTGTSANSSGIGADTSGNDNHFTPSNLAATDVTEDTCTNNFATMNSIWRNASAHSNTYSEGNLKINLNSSGGNTYSTIAVSQGKWYFEFETLSNFQCQFEGRTTDNFADYSAGAGNTTFTWYYSGNIKVNNSDSGVSQAYGHQSNNTNETKEICGVAVDLDNNKVYFHRQGTYVNSGNPSTGSNGITITNAEYMFGFSNDSGTTRNVANFNFGNPAFAVSSGNSDGKYGNFEYAVPSGYYALCTKRLAEFG